MEDIENGERDAGNSVIVIHPGSLHLRIGRASDSLPVTVPHCIAWKTKADRGSIKPWLYRKEALISNPDVSDVISAAAKEAQEQLMDKCLADGTYRQPTSLKDLISWNETLQADQSDVISQIQWTNVENQPEFITGDDALYLNPESDYNVIWPFAFGDLNVRNEPGYSLSAVIQSLETLWLNILLTILGIEKKDLKDYKCIVLIPDVFKRNHVRYLMDMLLERMGFSAALCIQESVCASFGAGLQSACIVDVGDQKTSISCVEDGVSIEQSRITLKYGGCDITGTLFWLLNRISFPYHSCHIYRNMLDALLMQELKHSYCHMNVDCCGSEDIYFQVRPPNQKITKYCMKVGEERILATLAVFWPGMFGLGTDSIVVTGACQQHDPSDPNDVSYIMQTRSKHEEAARLVAARKKEQNIQNQQDMADLEDSQKDLDDELIIDTLDEGQPTTGSQYKDDSNASAEGDWPLNKDGILALDHAILKSIDQCENDDLKKRMYSCIVVVGGGLMFEGVDNLLQYRISLQMPYNHRLFVDNVTVISRPKDLDPQIVCWKGGSLLNLLDACQELWIRKSEWLNMRSKVLRERAPFNW